LLYIGDISFICQMRDVFLIQCRYRLLYLHSYLYVHLGLHRGGRLEAVARTVPSSPTASRSRFLR
jgi:hypothetical protein